MIPASELRLGNFVIWAPTVFGGTKYVDIKQIKSIAESGANGVMSYSELDPIPLTEDWLLKFGFEKMPDLFTYDYLKGDFRLKQVEDGFVFGHDFECIWFVEQGRHLYYVHELQNLHFALTGQELTVNVLLSH